MSPFPFMSNNTQWRYSLNYKDISLTFHITLHTIQTHSHYQNYTRDSKSWSQPGKPTIKVPTLGYPLNLDSSYFDISKLLYNNWQYLTSNLWNIISPLTHLFSPKLRCLKPLTSPFLFCLPLSLISTQGWLLHLCTSLCKILQLLTSTMECTFTHFPISILLFLRITIPFVSEIHHSVWKQTFCMFSLTLKFINLDGLLLCCPGERDDSQSTLAFHFLKLMLKHLSAHFSKLVDSVKIHYLVFFFWILVILPFETT